MKRIVGFSRHGRRSYVSDQNENRPSNSTPRRLSTRWYLVLLGAIVLLALLLRFWGIGWALPYMDDYYDEQIIARVTLRMIANGDWNPHFFEYPSLYLYALRFIFDLHWYYGHATGLYTSFSQFPNRHQRYVTITGFYLWGRALTSILGAATVALLASIGRRWWNMRIGLMAALVLAVLPFHIRLSQTVRVDVASTLLTLLTLAAALRLIQRADLWSYMLAGFATGLAAATKYNAGAVFLAVIAAHVIQWRSASLRQIWRLLWAGLWSCLGFLAFTPYSLLTPDVFMLGMHRQLADYGSGYHGDLIGKWPVAGYAWFFGTTGLTPILALAAVLGIGVIVARREGAGLVLLTFALPYILFFMAWPQHFWRNLLPIFPPLVLFACIGIDAVSAWLSTLLTRTGQGNGTRFRNLHRTGCLLVLTAAAITLPLISTIQLNYFDALPDTRVQAAAYIQSSVPHDAKIAVELDRKQWRGNQHVVAVKDLTDHDAAWYYAHGIRYLVASSQYRHPNKRQAYDRLRAQTTLLQAFDNQPSPVALGIAWNQVSSLSARELSVRVEVLDLGAHSTARP